ncbi:MBL fold metallo-hydrolase [bacterium]|nr:MBL fold metallo-hydrolase [bacterium]
MANITVKTFPVGPLETNCYLVIDDNTKDALLIDPGAEAEELLTILEEEKIALQAVVLTHGHGDHIGAVSKIVSEKNVPLWIHPDDASMLTDSEENLSAMLGLSVTSEHPYKEFTDKETINFGSIQVEVLHTPGHTRGGVSLFIQNDTNPILFSGDTLFKGDVGRCDLPGGDWDTLRKSILEKLYVLPYNTVVYPGHGPSSTIGNEKITNNYVKAI